MMLPGDLFKLAGKNLLLHKVRSILTSLGVIFGVGSVIAMLAISEGAKRMALSQIEAMGIDNIIVSSKRPPIEGKNETNQQGTFEEPYGLTRADLGHIEKMDNVLRVVPARNSRLKILRGITRMDLKLIGVGDDFLADSGSTIEQGRWFSPADSHNHLAICVIGSNVKRRMFPLGVANVIGKDLPVDGGRFRFRIVGVMNNDQGSQYPEIGNVNDGIYIPMAVSDQLFDNYSYSANGNSFSILLIDYDLFIVKVRDLKYIDDTSKRISAYLDKTHSKTKDWDIIVPLDLLKQREATQNIFTIVMSSIAGISLIVGGIGIMNIMLASVYERRKEIGTRRALGAQKADILLQFLIETVFLTSLGGIMGILLGVGISRLITIYADMPTVYSWWSIALSLFISSLVGVIFGTYPAWKAAQQNPITVLRAE